jgi:predicted dehydrogenase
MTKRREFLKKTAAGSAGIAIGGMGFSPKSFASIIGANDRINLAVIGIRNQGSVHINRWCALKDSHNVVVRTICDADERLFDSRSKLVTEKSGVTPKTEWDMRKVFDDKDIHAVSIVTPNHWHALATIWACQAGKHVYVEKPVSHNIFEGRKMVEAGIRYKVHIQHGASPARGEALDFLHSGGIGKVYMVRGLCLHRRDSYGFASSDKNTEPPAGFHYDMWLGPAPYRPYNEKRGHYCWHWYWDTGCGDTGNTGPHAIHSARTGIQKNEHPVYAVSNGGLYGFSESDKGTQGVNSYGDVETYGDNMTTQETPNTQACIFKYSDGTVFLFDTRGRYTNTEGINNISDGIIFYGTEGYMEYTGGWKAFRHWEKQPFAGAGIGENKAPAERGAGRPNLYSNFLEVIRSGKDEDLVNPIITGHYGATLVHLANISYRLGGRSLNFDKTTEKFVNDPEADALLTRPYRAPFIVPDKV